MLSYWRWRCNIKAYMEVSSKIWRLRSIIKVVLGHRWKMLPWHLKLYTGSCFWSSLLNQWVFSWQNNTFFHVRRELEIVGAGEERKRVWTVWRSNTSWRYTKCSIIAKVMLFCKGCLALISTFSVNLNHYPHIVSTEIVTATSEWSSFSAS